ncbi:MAG: hypothetical protein ACE15C_09515 [Phycisphaerae bacterium]
MFKQKMMVPTVVMAVLALPAWADDKEGIHVTGSSTSSSLNLNDGAGYRWDITSNGVVNGGGNNAYDGGMQLSVNNSSFSWNGSGRISADGREIEMGPWNINQVSISRRIYVPAKKGYCRWIDIFENNSSSNQTLNVQYYTNTSASAQSVYSTSGRNEIADKDWGAVTMYPDRGSSPAPALIHVYSCKGSKVKPKFQYKPSDDNLYYNMTIAVPAGKAVALCFFEAQRSPAADAKKFFDSFSPQQELDSLPANLRKIILNMTSSASLSLGRLEMKRDEKQDLAVLRNGDELLGEILNPSYTVETFYGRLELEAKRVLGVVVPEADDPNVLVALTDGQVVVGKLTSAPLKMKLANGSEMALPPSKFNSIAYRMSREKADEGGPKSPAVVLRSGQQLFFKPSDGDWTYQTEYGEVKLNPADLQAIFLDTPDGGLHRAVFRNGSVLSGLLKAPTQKLQLELGPTLTAGTSAIQQIIFPVAEADKQALAEMTLRNEDQLIGTIAEQSIAVQSKLGKVTIAPREMSELQMLPEALGQVQIKLHNGTAVTGKLVARTLKFKIEPGPELPVFVGHITRIACPAADAVATTGPATTGPSVKPTPTPTPVADVPDELKGVLGQLLKKRESILAAIADGSMSKEQGAKAIQELDKKIAAAEEDIKRAAVARDEAAVRASEDAKRAEMIRALADKQAEKARAAGN